MTFTAFITSQGQLNIPIKARRLLGIEKSQKAIVTVKDNKLIVEPIKDLLTLGGSLHSSKKPLSNSELHDLFASYLAKRHRPMLRRKKWKKY